MAGFLFLVTGLHTGAVGLTVELHDQAPFADASWQEITEVSYHPAGLPSSADEIAPVQQRALAASEYDE